ncbi:hypothetical protein ABB37_00255 [Leptomonas pyrrhocoris]|uniref:Glycerophosphocholine acyltransferase 1 n=1 Tax=Leptomonas pyrrhocoris TaxID=157538 RepID=A0A0M9GA92_LEPPY|nr:hypothetical protein ABB37_00255 [Leptomonas pyrrhocoris]KPA85959.1 hypothetical protein ABB37_00255 [Leptomonas pyrrhocoris]|eukprot:XP_015664398.1 hypothetical protein ABB37_00255 [Leptomonas pyrrhocoris]
MDHDFSKTQYFLGCSFTLVYTGLVAAAYFDISTCPYVYDRPASTAPLKMPDAAQTCNGVANIHRSLLASLTSAGGFSCHMVDIIVWAYVIGLIVFMSYKYVTYRLQGFHYFFLDYCYFHNAVLLFFLLWRLVDVEWSEQPIVSWASYMPSWGWLKRTSAAGSKVSAFNCTNSSEEPRWRHPILTGTPLGGDSFARRIVPSTARSFCLDGVYLPVSVDVLTCGYVVAHLTEAEVLSSFVLFFTLLAGSCGPILGAIVMWKNALLFHSFDRMSSCYLHLAPGIVQGLLLHRFFISARREMESVDAEQLYAQITKLASQMQIPVENLLPSVQAIVLNQTETVVNAAKAASSSRRGPARLLSSLLSSLSLKQQQQHFSRYAAAHRLEALCGYGTLCYDLRRAVTFGSLLRLHLFMFCIWQLFYHVFNEWRRHAREKPWKKRIAQLEKEKAEFMQLTGATENEVELLRPSMVTSEGAGGNPAERMTSYTWMMANPPGGYNGVLARVVMLFGKGRLPTTIMFQVTQWLLHMVFFTCSYPVIYICFHHSLSAWPLLVWVLTFACVCVYNAACVNRKWIMKLQQMASKGMEAERQDQLTKSMAAAAAAKKAQ